MSSKGRAKHWIVVLNNPRIGDVPNLKQFDYAVFGYEEGGEESTPHWQGFVSFKKRMRFAQVKMVFPRAHVEVKSTRSTFLEASAYCKKDGVWYEWGECPISQSIRMKRKWADAFEMAKEGRMYDCPPQMIIQYGHSLKRIERDFPSKPTNLEAPCGLWLVGLTGTGKTRYATDKWPNLYDKPLNKWWDGYQGQETCLLDEVTPDHGKWLAHLLLRWSDWKSFPAEQKGTTIQIRPKRIVVTSNYSIGEVFHEHVPKQTLESIKRRFEVKEFVKVSWMNK